MRPALTFAAASLAPISSIGALARALASIGARHTPPMAPASGPRAVLDPAVRVWA